MSIHDSKKSILFVCMGNICRSPAAEEVFRHLAQQRGLEGVFHIDSAGTIGYHSGEYPDRRMRQAAADRGYILRSRARQVVAEDLDRFDLIVGMDRENLEALRAMDATGEHGDKLRLLCEYISGDCPEEVPDPYYGGKEGFNHVLDLLEEASGPILDSLNSEAVA